MKVLQVFDNVDVNNVVEVEELELRMYEITYEIENGIYDVGEVMRMHGVYEEQAFDIVRDELAVASKAFMICGLLLDNIKGE